MDLPEELIALLRQPSLCFIATTMPDGSPQLTETWVDTDGEHVVINTVQGNQKTKNIERNPRVAVNICDPANPSRYFEIRGHVVSATHRGWRRTHRGARPEVPGRSVPLVRRS